MTPLCEIEAFLAALAPPALAEDWDNTGTLVRCADAVDAVLCALDVTPEVVREAQEKGCGLIVSHHPVIFHPLKRLSAYNVPALLVCAGISVISLHTNLDKAAGGVNDALCERLGLTDVSPFAEGLGRVGTLPAPMTPEALARYVSARLSAPVRFASADKEIRRTAVVSGSGGEFAVEAAQAGAGCLITGEAGHHDAWDALAAGVTLMAATHFGTEQFIADVLARRIGAAFPALRVLRSTADRDPFQDVPGCAPAL